jgi:phosphatidate cytidylyltransferase
VTRVLSAIVLLPLVVGTIWFLPPIATLVLAEVALLLAFVEYARLVEQLGARMSRAICGVGTAATCLAAGSARGGVEVTLLIAMLAIGVAAVLRGRRGPEALRDVGASVLPLLYLGLPLGSLAAVRGLGPGPVLLLMLTVMISDTAQYYGGRAFGSRPLAPAISPKKTVEGAFSGLVAGVLAMPLLARWWLPQLPAPSLALLGGAIVALGIAGDLFESMLKRSAGVKDASGLIPGHGGMLDRIDSLLFAAPAYYSFLRYAL